MTDEQDIPQDTAQGEYPDAQQMQIPAMPVQPIPVKLTTAGILMSDGTPWIQTFVASFAGIFAYFMPAQMALQIAQNIIEQANEALADAEKAKAEQQDKQDIWTPESGGIVVPKGQTKVELVK